MLRSLEELARREYLRVGVSNTFFQVENFLKRYCQARRALELMERLHEKDSRACRDGLALTLNELMAEDKSISYVDCDLMSCINTQMLMKNYPDRAFEAGIAEGNAAGVAAGLAATGKKSFVHSFGTFSSRRCYDQIYMSAAYAGLTVHVPPAGHQLRPCQGGPPADEDGI